MTLRERNRARTRAEIRKQALALFRDQGYAATTVEQIAKAAEVSQSTFFRHFASKEELVLRDDYDPALIACFDALPPEMGPLEALRVSMRTVLGTLSPEEQQLELERHRLIMSTPELRGPILEDLANNVELFAQMIGKRVGRPPGDFEVRNLAGAVLGVVQTAMLTDVTDDGEPMEFFLEHVERALKHLEDGLPL